MLTWQCTYNALLPWEDREGIILWIENNNIKTISYWRQFHYIDDWKVESFHLSPVFILQGTDINKVSSVFQEPSMKNKHVEVNASHQRKLPDEFLSHQIFKEVIIVIRHEEFIRRCTDHHLWNSDLIPVTCINKKKSELSLIYHHTYCMGRHSSLLHILVHHQGMT